MEVYLGMIAQLIKYVPKSRGNTMRQVLVERAAFDDPNVEYTMRWFVPKMQPESESWAQTILVALSRVTLLG